MYNLIQMYINKAFTTKQLLFEELRLTCEIPTVVLTGSYVLKYYYNVLERDIKDIDVLLLTTNIDCFDVIRGYEHIIGTNNCGSNEGYTSNSISTVIMSNKVEFFLNNKENNLNPEYKKVATMKSIFYYKRKFNIYKAFKDYKETLRLRETVQLPF